MYSPTSNKSARLAGALAKVWLLFFTALILLAVLYLPSVKPDTNILSLLPLEQQSPLIEKSQQQINKQWQNTVIWLAAGNTPNDAVTKARELEKTLKNSALFSELKLQWQPDNSSSLYPSLLAWRYQLLTAKDKAAINEDAAGFLQQRLQLLYSPVGMQYAMTLESDPFFTYGSYINGLMAKQDADLYDGVVILRDGELAYALIISQVAEQGFYGQKALAKLHGDITAEGNLGAGMPLYSAYGAASAEKEISLVGGFSVIAVILLMLWCFRSLLPLAMALTSIITGMLAAILACWLVFGHIHIITLAFGSSLIGITIDYSFHYFCDRLRKDCGSTMHSLRTVLPGIALGIGSSMIAYGILLLTPFPALQQIGLFTVAGLSAAWLTVVLLYPFVTQYMRLADNMPTPGVYAAYLYRWPQFCYRWRYILLLLVAVFLASGLSRLSSVDDIRQMQKPSPVVLEQEQKIISLGQQRQDSQYFIVSAATPDALLAKEQQLSQGLDKLQAQGKIQEYQALSRHLPSLQEQNDNWQLFQQKLFASGVFEQSMQQLAMQQESINNITESFMRSKDQQISIEQWLKALPSQWQDLWLACETQCSSIVRLTGIKDTQVLKDLAALADNTQLLFVDTVADINQMLKHYRHVAAGFLVLAFAVILIFLSAFAGWRRALKILIVPISAQLLALASLSLLGYGISMFHLFGLLLALGISMDYAIFHAMAKHPLTVAMAVLFSLFTSLLAFGLLATSATALIQAFGLSLALGIFFAFLLAPLINSNAKAERDVYYAP